MLNPNLEFIERTTKLPLPRKDMNSVTIEEKIICCAKNYFSPPNAGAPIFKHPEDILQCEPASVHGNPCLETVLASIHGLKSAVGDEIPIAGVIISPPFPFLSCSWGLRSIST